MDKTTPCANTELPCDRVRELDPNPRGWRKGYCLRCYTRIRNGTPLDGPVKRRQNAPLEASLVRDRESGCLLWTAGRSGSGYGYLGNKRVHVLVWEKAHGPVPPGMFVCHKCDVRRCAELSHLFLGTHKENMRDMVRKGRSAKLRGVEHSQAKLTEREVLEILRDERGFSELGREYGVAAATIRSIKRGENWKHLSRR